MGGPAGWGQLAWWARLTCHLAYLRLITRGAERCRREGLSAGVGAGSRATRGCLGGDSAGSRWTPPVSSPVELHVTVEIAKAGGSTKPPRRLATFGKRYDVLIT